MVRTRSKTTSAPSPREVQSEEKGSKSSSKSPTKGVKRDAEQADTTEDENSPVPKKARTERVYMTDVIERGHLYFFYRPKVQHESAESLDEVRNMHMLLVPRPPKFSVDEKTQTQVDDSTKPKVDNEEDRDHEKAEMEILAPGADAVPAPATETPGEPKQHFRLITIGKKHLPDLESGGPGKGRKQTFWATVTSVGDDLHALEQGLGEKTYETKTRGTRHEAPARLAARGAYTIVNNNPEVPSKRTTHFGYHISHPHELGDVQKDLGISNAASFVLQVKNPAPATGPQQIHSKGAEYSEDIMTNVFGKGGGKGRESYGLRFVRCEMPEILDYMGAELLLIATSAGEEGVETSLGEGRGKALAELEADESKEAVETLLRGLEADAENAEFPLEALKGNWI